MIHVETSIEINNFDKFSRILLRSCPENLNAKMVVIHIRFSMGWECQQCELTHGEIDDIKDGAYIYIDSNGTRKQYRVVEIDFLPQSEQPVKHEKLITCDVCLGIYPTSKINRVDDVVGTDVFVERYKCEICDAAEKAVMRAWTKRWGLI